MEALGINLGYIIMQIALFIILMTVLRNYAYDPIINMLEERKAKIAKGLEDARQAAIARENADAEAKKILDAARAEASKVRQDAAVQAEETAKGIVAQAHDEARGVVAAARDGALEERDRILSELRGQVAAISIAAANKLVGESLSEDRQRALIGDFFAKAPAKIAGLSGNTAEVVSALPLTDAEQASLKGSIKAENVSFKVDPKILGGLIVRVGDQVVDDSVASRMSALGGSLN
ncbi:MAG: F0F1 ATP synthase subunit B [Anaerolineales bacterium]|nr:F0F1 ATP synthase subunit B [Anaerolineales bacterium]MCB9431896.1 F0F1 ATP synthase subunit B [Ardenticatenaceae bacterium]